MPFEKFTTSPSNRANPSPDLSLDRQGALFSKNAPSSAAASFSAHLPNKTPCAIHNFPNPDEEVNVRQEAGNKFERTSK
jgi:hypothetical protein